MANWLWKKKKAESSEQFQSGIDWVDQEAGENTDLDVIERFIWAGNEDFYRGAKRRVRQLKLEAML